MKTIGHKLEKFAVTGVPPQSDAFFTINEESFPGKWKVIVFYPKDFTFISDLLVGTYYLVIPKTAKEVYYLQLLIKNIDVFIPAEGDGLIITRKALQGI